MKLQHQTEVAASPEKVWDFLQDTRAVVQCLPGAELVDELGDDHYQGVLRVAVGPLKMNYAGEVSVVERNADERQIALDASGRDKRGSGAVQAHVQLQVVPDAQGSKIDVVSDLVLTGRIASLGRGIRDVSNSMFVDFAAQLGDRVVNPEGAATRAEQETSGQSRTTSTDHSTASMSQVGAQRSNSSVTTPDGAPRDSSEIKVLPLILTVTREKLARLFARLSERLSPQ